MAEQASPGRNFGVLTGGGDAPGLNAAICGLGRRLLPLGHRLIGFRDGWRGVIEDDAFVIGHEMFSDLLAKGGTILGSSSANPLFEPERDIPRVKEVMRRHELSALVVIGGDGTLQAAHKLYEDEGMPMVGVPKTIDNDLCCTDFTFGFFTAVERVTRAIDELRTTAESHSRIMVVECMGRHTGWITAYAGVAGGAEGILVPERPVELRELFGKLERLRASGRRSAILAVAEGARIHLDGKLLSTEEKDRWGHYKTGGSSELVAQNIEAELDWEARAVHVGHLQRAGRPLAIDRIFALRLGARAARLALSGRFGRMSCMQGGEIADVPIADAVARFRMLSDHFLDRYENFFSLDLDQS